MKYDVILYENANRTKTYYYKRLENGRENKILSTFSVVKFYFNKNVVKKTYLHDKI